MMFAFAVFTHCHNVAKCPTGVLEITHDVPDSEYSNCDTEFTIKFNGESTNIGIYSFAKCKGLIGTLLIPETTTTIGESAFSKCINLKELKFAKGTNNLEIGSESFARCSSLSGNLEIPDRVSLIGEYAFMSCISLNGKLILSNSLTNIPKCCFLFCKSLTGKLIIPDSVKTLGIGSFALCSFTSLYIGEKLEDISFNSNYKLNEIEISNKNKNFKYIDGIIYSYDEKMLIFCQPGKSGNVVIPSTVKKIAPYAFYNCTKLTGNVEIPNGVESIGYESFSFCTGLSGYIKIPASVKDLGTSGILVFSNIKEYKVDEKNPNYKSMNGILFNKEGTELIDIPPGKKGNIVIPEGVNTLSVLRYHNNNFTSLTVPASATSIYRINYLEKFIVHKDNTKYKDIDGVLYDKITNQVVLSPKGKKGKVTIFNIGEINDHENKIGMQGTIAEKQYWNANEFALSSGCETDYMVKNGIIFSKDEKEIVWCPGAKEGEIVIPESVTKIRNFAFVNCYKLTGSLNIPSSVTEIGSSAFLNCVGLTGILTFGSSESNPLPANDLSIGNEAFYGAGFTGEVLIPENVVSIGTNVFDKCSAIESIKVDAKNVNFKSVDGVLFNKNENRIVSYPENKKGSFSIPNDVDKIDISSFKGKKNLESISIDDSNSKYKTFEGLLYDNSMKTLLRCPEGKIGEIKLPSSVETIGRDAFFGCSKLTNIVIPEQVTTIESQAFSECSSKIEYLGKTVLEFECGLSPNSAVVVVEGYPGNTFCNVIISAYELGDNGNKGLDGGTIAGIAISCLVAVAAISFCVYWFVFRKKIIENESPEAANNEAQEE